VYVDAGSTGAGAAAEKRFVLGLSSGGVRPEPSRLPSGGSRHSPFELVECDTTCIVGAGETRWRGFLVVRVFDAKSRKVTSPEDPSMTYLRGAVRRIEDDGNRM